MEKEKLSFLEENIKEVKKYKKSGYDKYEYEEIQSTSEVIEKYYNILEKIKNPEEKDIFKNFFITKLNIAFKGGFAPTDKKQLLEVLDKIEKNIEFINGYEITTENLEQELNKILLSNYKNKLKKLQEKILKGENISIEKELEKIIIYSIPFKRTESNIFSLNMEKGIIDKLINILYNGVNLGDFQVKIINGLNIGLNSQIIILSNTGIKKVIIRTKNNIFYISNLDDIFYTLKKDKISLHIKLNSREYLEVLINKNNIFYKRLTSQEYKKIFGNYYLNKIIYIDKPVREKFIKNKGQTLFSKQKKSKEIKKKDTYKINKGFDRLSIEKKKDIILSLLTSPIITKHIENILSRLENKIVIIKLNSKHYKIKLSKQFIEKNKAYLINNFRKIIYFFLLFESNLNLTAKHHKSSAKGIGQWLTNNGFYDKEHYRHTSSFETSLNYASKLGFKLKGVDYPIRKKVNISPEKLSLQTQVSLVIYTIFSRCKKYYGNLTHLLGALLGNERSIKMLYVAYIGRSNCKGLNCLTKQEIRNIKRKFKRHYFKIYNPKTKKWN